MSARVLVPDRLVEIAGDDIDSAIPVDVKWILRFVGAGVGIDGVLNPWVSQFAGCRVLVPEEASASEVVFVTGDDIEFPGAEDVGHDVRNRNGAGRGIYHDTLKWNGARSLYWRQRQQSAGLKGFDLMGRVRTSGAKSTSPRKSRLICEKDISKKDHIHHSMPSMPRGKAAMLRKCNCTFQGHEQINRNLFRYNLLKIN